MDLIETPERFLMISNNQGPTNELKVAVIQADISWHNVQANLQNIEKIISSLENVDIVVLPEMWITGFTMKTHLMKDSGAIGFKAMQQWSAIKECLLTGSLLHKTEDGFVNRAFVFDSGELIATYDKKHLFGFSGEDRYFLPGRDKCIISYRSWKLCLNICYDLRFPIWSRNLEDYDVLFFVANWPKKRIEAWDALLPARGVENQCYVIAANCTGVDAWKNEYSGHSQIINFDGSRLAFTKKRNDVLYVNLSKERLELFRTTFPFLKDRDQIEFV